MSDVDQKHLQTFITELEGFAVTAEAALKKIEADPEANRSEFSFFSERMFVIRGTSQQLGFSHIARFAEMGEEIALKAVTAPSRAHVRKCVGALWDTLTTIKHLLVEHHAQGAAADTAEEQGILMNRLEATLKSLGGAREKASADDIEALLKSRA